MQALRTPAMPHDARLGQLMRAAWIYGAARNLGGGAGVDTAARYAPLLGILDALPADLPQRGFAHTVDFAKRSIRHAYPASNGLDSFASKMLWLPSGPPFVVYDSRARAALKVRTNDLQAYEAAWRGRFQ